MSEKVTVDLLRTFLDAFNRHDLDSIMAFFADDCEFFKARAIRGHSVLLPVAYGHGHTWRTSVA